MICIQKMLGCLLTSKANIKISCIQIHSYYQSLPHSGRKSFLVANFHASNRFSSTDFAADLDDLPTTRIIGTSPKRVHVTVVLKSKPTPVHLHPARVPYLETTVNLHATVVLKSKPSPTSCKSDPFGNHRAPHRSRQFPFAKLSTKLQFLTRVVFSFSFSMFMQIYIITCSTS